MKSVLRLFVLICIVSMGVYAQSGLGTISGMVTDVTGAVVPGVTVKLIQLSTNSERVTVTNEVGLFTMPSLVASKYKVVFSLPGFQDKVFDNVELNAMQNLSMGAIVIEVGSFSTVVDVTTEAALVATENAVRNDTIQSKQVTNMPIQGRNWTTLLKIIPGASPTSNQGITGREAGYDGIGDFRVNGKAANQTQLNLDGGSNVDHGNDNKTTVTPSLESIQEVAVLTNNFQAEYGIRAGVIVNVITKSGTNQFHATVWDYLRNEALNANSADNNFLGLRRPRYRFNYFGANVGGPIRRDKLFFFFNHESLKQDTPTAALQSRVPTALERTGNFSQTVNANGTRPVIYMPGTQASGNPVPVPNNILPAGVISPLGTAIANIYPLPNLTGQAFNNYVNQFSKEDRRWLNVLKVDWNVNSTTRAYVRYNYDYQRLRDITTGSTGVLPFNVIGRDRPDKALTVNVTKTFSANLVNENLFNWQKDFVEGPLSTAKFPDKLDRTKVGLADLPLVFPTQSNIIPQVTGTGYADFAFNRFPWYAKAPEAQFSSTWTWIHGAHTYKAGGQFIINKKDEVDTSLEKGSFNFGVNTSSRFDTGFNMANLMAGALSQFQQVSNPAHKYSKYQDIHFFIQDTWKITPKLTLDYGTRFYHIPSEYNTRPDETLDAVFMPSLWDPRKAPRFYVADPTNPSRVIDPAFPAVPVNSALLYSIVPGSGDLLNGVVPLGSPEAGRAGVRDPRFLLIAPRGGFAWQFLNKTVLRGGFGWSYNRPGIGSAIGTFENGLADAVDYRQTSLATLTSTTIKRLTPRNFGAKDESSNAVPTIYDFSLSVQRELPAGFLLDVAYVGNVQKHQLINFNINSVLPGTAWRPEFIDPRLAGNNFAGPVTASNPGALPGTRSVDANLMRPYTGLGNLNLITNVGNNHYNSLQTNLQKRYQHGLTMQFVHTWGKLISGIENPGPFYYRWKDYTGARANNDRTHTVAINYTYEIPSLAKKFGWQSGVLKQLFDGWGVAHLMNFISGRVLTPTFSLQYANSAQDVANLNAIFTGSPDIAPRLQPIANPNTGTSDVAQMYDVNAFVLPAVPGDGTGSRNYLYSPGTFSNDINVNKTIAIGEGRGLELRASFFNPFNQSRRQDLNINHIYKMNGSTLGSGYSLFNTPERLAQNLATTNPNATVLQRYNQYRTGVGHQNVTSVLDPRRIEIGLRFKF